MVQSGLMDEVRILHRRLRECTERGEVIDRTRGIWQSIGFRQMEAFLDGELNKASDEVLARNRAVGLEEINIATRQYARYQLRWIRQRTLRSFKEHEAMDLLYLLDSANADNFTASVVQPAVDICRQYLAGERRAKPTEVSNAAREALMSFDNGCTTDVTAFKVKKCEVCDVSLPTEDSWTRHVHGKKHRRVVRMKKNTSLVLVEDDRPLSEESSPVVPTTDVELSLVR
jgi:tRNA dimethylallyltransferase